MERKFILLLLLFQVATNLFAQTSDIVKSDSILYSVHKSNIGKIAFFSKNSPIESFTETDFLKIFELKEKSELNIRVFLGKSLTNYLHLLSSQLPAEALTKKGNYQFTFLVNDQKIYVENLNFGAGSIESKNKRTVFNVPLISATNEDSWGRFLWNRFLINGGQDAFTDGEHVLKIEIRPYLKQDEMVTGEIIAEGELKIVVPEFKISEKLVKVQHINQLTDLKISKSKIDTLKIEELNRKIVKQFFKDVTSVVVLKEGELLLEQYFNEANRNTLHDTRSVGKSFASTLLGIAIDDNYIKSETQTLNEFYNLNFFQNYSIKKDQITLKDLLTMSSTFGGSDMNFESAGHEEKMYATKNWVDFTLNLSVDKLKEATKQWDYFTAGVIVLGDVINKSVPDGLEKYSIKKLFVPLGITKYKWQFTPQKVANTAGSLQLRSLDYAKYGQLYKNQGAWNGKQILSKEWINKSLSHQIAITENEFYGYLFWNKTYKVKNIDYEVYYSSGNGGNRIFIFKDQPLVVVITATAYNTPFGQKQVDKIMQDYIIPALIN